MSKIRIFIALLSISGFVTINAQSGGDNIINTVTTAVPFLRITPDARSGGMGDVGLATTPDMYSFYHNPAKMAFIDGKGGAAITYTPWLTGLGVKDINLVGLNGYYKIKQKQTISLGFRYFSLGKITFIDENQVTLKENFRPYEMGLDAHYSRQLGKYFSIGAGLRFVFSNLATGLTLNGNTIKPGVAGAGDISFYFAKPVMIKSLKSDVSVGLAFSNIGNKMTYSSPTDKDAIPTNMGIGAGWRFHIKEKSKIGVYLDANKLMAPTGVRDKNDPNYDKDNNGKADFRELGAVEGMFKSFADAPGWKDANGNFVKGSKTKEEFREVTWGVGVEYEYAKRFSFKTGYFYEHNTKGGRQFMTAGIGVKYSAFALDFSYLIPTTTTRKPLDNTLRFTLSFNFGQKEDELFDKLKTSSSGGTTEPTPKKKKSGSGGIAE